jgi:hypothetical protein
LRGRLAREGLNREAVQERQRWQNLSLTQKSIDWVLRYRWHLFVAGWATSMGVAWMILRRNKTQTFAQKIVQARVYAQGIALAGLLGAAGLSHMQDPDHGARRYTADHSWQRSVSSLLCTQSQFISGCSYFHLDSRTTRNAFYECALLIGFR